MPQETFLFSASLRDNLTLGCDCLLYTSNPEASIYGEYRNQLSIVAEDVQVVSK